jgi:hypothetical protein
MKALDMEVGSKVDFAKTCSSSFYKHTGVIIGNQLSDGDEVVAVEWSDGSITKVNVNDLKLVETKLETDFEEIVKQINLKILDAAQAMSDARQLASDVGVTSLAHNYREDAFDDVDIYPLFNELDEAGWRTSSIGC